VGKTKLKAQLALWRRRVKFRRHRHDLWQRRLTAARKKNTHPRQRLVDLRDKWSRRLAEANAQVVELERELAHRTHAKGIDVSNNNGHVDFSRVHKAGYRFVWAKASEGSTFTDAFFLPNVEAARRVGLKVGGYHFLRPKAGAGAAEIEARHFASRLRAAGIGIGDLLPVVDVEVTELSFTATEAYVQRFVDELVRQIGVKPLIYTFPAFLSWRSTHGCRLWIANFGVTIRRCRESGRATRPGSSRAPRSCPGWPATATSTLTPDLENLIR
jgi:GH25 family lysozyme M1 (1,4-beta-N-acetylmuramidase)